MAKASVKGLEEQAALIGTLYAKVYLHQLSADDRDDAISNQSIRAQILDAYSAASAEVGDQKAMKAALKAVRYRAEAAIWVARKYGRAPGGDSTPVVQAAEQALRQILTDREAVPDR
jgi:hypothetical protein